MKLVRRLVGGLMGALLLGMLTGGSPSEAQAGCRAVLGLPGQQHPSGDIHPGVQSSGRPLFSAPPFIDRSTPISERPFAKPFIDRGPSIADRPLSPIGGGVQVAPAFVPGQLDHVVAPRHWVWCDGQWVWADGHRHDGDVCSAQ